MQWVGHPKETSLLAGSLWEDVEKVLSLHLLSYFPCYFPYFLVIVIVFQLLSHV